MSVQTEIERIIAVKEAIRLAIVAKGVPVAVELMLTDYAEKIGLISTGPVTFENPCRVRYIDSYDGTILKEQIVESGEDSTPPDDPVHDLVTFGGWNIVSTNITHDTDIGAIYDTDDGKTIIFATFNANTGLSPNLFLNKSTNDLMTITWGDGTTSTSSAIGNFNVNHTYPAGSYIITLTCAGAYSFANGSATYSIFTGNYRHSITSIYIGASVTSIGNYAFSQCNSLISVTIPSSVTSIGNIAFNACYSLKSIVISSSVITIGTNAFSSCSSLNLISIPSGITSIGNSAFTSCVSLTSIVIPESVTSIGTYAFSGCNSLSSVIIPSGITSIGNNTFNACVSLNSIVISSSVTSIGNYAFAQCDSLVSIVIPESVTSIGDYAFNACNLLTSISIPASVTSLGVGAFYNSSCIVEYVFNSVIPPTMADIGVFQGIKKLAKIYVPDASVTAYKTATNWLTYANYIYPLSTKPV